MYYLMWIEIEGFYVKATSPDPLTVLHREKRVLDAAPEARSRKVQPGMSLAEARAILPNGKFLAWEEEAYRDAQSQWLDVCTDFTDSVEPIDQHIALLDLSAHPDPSALALRLLEELQQAGWNARAGAARTRWVAQLACRGAFLLNEILDGASFVAALPVSALPIEPQEAERLAFLGCRSADEVVKTPIEVLREQFGERAISLRRYALGRGETHVEALYPPNSLAAQFRLEGPAETTEALQRSLQKVARVLGARLRESDLSGKQLEVFLEAESGAIEKRSRQFARSMQSEGSVFACLALLFGNPPNEPTVAIRVRMPHLERAKRVQRELTGQLDRDERERSAMAAFAQVRNAFGDQAVVIGQDRPTARRTRVLRVWKDATGWV